MRRPGTPAAALAMMLVIGACTLAPAGNSEEAVAMQLTSEAFAEGGAIPSDHTCDGSDTSPPLKWSEVPDGTGAFALIVDDPDARGFVHWVLTDIPGDRRELGAGEGDHVGVPGANDFGRIGWAGPCPPSGRHRYVFTLYALEAPLGLSEGAGADQARSAIAERSLGEAQLTGVYTRGG
jgi:Raf kinase inhibitor-like YbhB/YbcL family protein